MIKDNRIYNIYYMLAYAFDDNSLLNSATQREKTEFFENIYDLFSFILTNMVGSILKRGIYKDYILEKEEKTSIRGKININESVKTNSMKKKMLVCEYDEYSSNNYLNQIIKTTVFYLLKSLKVSKIYRKNLKNVYIMLNDISIIADINNIRWNSIHYTANNKTYKMVINICYLIIKQLIVVQDDGKFEFQEFFDKQSLPTLFEAFVRNYYKKEHKGKINVGGSRIDRNTRSSNQNLMELLPSLNTDITIIHKDVELIIDTKCYEKIISDKGFRGVNSKNLNANHINQIQNYVMHEVWDCEKKGIERVVKGMLLYVKVSDEQEIHFSFNEMGNDYFIETIDLCKQFDDIKQQLDSYLFEYVIKY